jgi:disulfide oxidoreductase YuzD
VTQTPFFDSIDEIALGRTTMTKTKIKWLKEPQKHDYPAAESYLSLILEPRAAKAVAEQMESAEIMEVAAKDIFRASGVSLLGVSNSHVEKDRSRIIRDEELSPLLLFRDANRRMLIIADGYHRLCAVYTFDEDAMIPCKIA